MPRRVAGREATRPSSQRRLDGFANLPFHRAARIIHAAPTHRDARLRGLSSQPLKEGLHCIEHDLSVYSQGGKGAAARKTPAEILERCERLTIDSGPLFYASRMMDQVDSAAVQDEYQLYRNAFFFSGAAPRALTTGCQRR